MSIDLDLLKDEPITPEQAADYVAAGAKGVAIKGIMLRGYEVAAYQPLQPELGWVELKKFGNTTTALLRAEQEAKWWFQRENQRYSLTRGGLFASATSSALTPPPFRVWTNEARMDSDSLGRLVPRYDGVGWALPGSRGHRRDASQHQPV